VPDPLFPKPFKLALLKSAESAKGLLLNERYIVGIPFLVSAPARAVLFLYDCIIVISGLASLVLLTPPCSTSSEYWSSCTLIEGSYARLLETLGPFPFVILGNLSFILPEPSVLPTSPLA